MLGPISIRLGRIHSKADISTLNFPFQIAVLCGLNPSNISGVLLRNLTKYPSKKLDVYHRAY